MPNEVMSVRLTRDVLQQIDRARRADEDRAAFMREAVAAELARRQAEQKTADLACWIAPLGPKRDFER